MWVKGVLFGEMQNERDEGCVLMRMERERETKRVFEEDREELCADSVKWRKDTEKWCVLGRVARWRMLNYRTKTSKLSVLGTFGRKLSYSNQIVVSRQLNDLNEILEIIIHYVFLI